MDVIIDELHMDLAESEKLYRYNSSARPGDKKTRFLHIYLYNKGETFVLKNTYVAYLRAKKADKNIVCRDSSLSEKDIQINTIKNYISIELIPQLISCAGIVECELEIQDGEQSICTNKFIIKVGNPVIGVTDIKSTSDYGSFKNALGQELEDYLKDNPIENNVYYGSEEPPEDSVIWIDPDTDSDTNDDELITEEQIIKIWNDIKNE